MNKGIEILLERMKSNPEEFVPEYEGGTTKWNSIMASYRGFLNKEELEVFDEAHKKMVFNHMQEKFTQVVMKELLDPKPLANPYTVSPSVTLSGGTTPAVWANTTSTGQVTLPNGSITLGKTTLQEQQLQQLLEMKLEVDKQKHQTIVGKLYNYLGVNK
jgi:hypothetical protein